MDDFFTIILLSEIMLLTMFIAWNVGFFILEQFNKRRKKKW